MAGQDRDSFQQTGIMKVRARAASARNIGMSGAFLPN
jgi:hypothetical protein